MSMKHTVTSSQLVGRLLFALLLALSPSAVAAEINLVAFGDWGWMNSAAERATAQRIAAYARMTSTPPCCSATISTARCRGA